MTEAPRPTTGLIDSHYGAFIDGDFVSSTSGDFPAIDAATGELLSQISRCGTREIDQAVISAREAFKTWSLSSPETRAAMLLALAGAIEANIDRFAEIDARDIGRRITETEIDHRIAIGEYRFFAGAAMTHYGFNRSMENGYAISKREPLGVIGQIIPWNVPAIMVAHKLAPALAAGNTVVLKPDENASLSTMELCKLVAEIFPPGVVNVVPGMGEEAGKALTEHPGVRMLAFTGSPEVGRLIAMAAGQLMVPAMLELGGKSPNIVFPDIEDINAVVDNAAFATTYCNGQSCLAGTRLFVHDAIYDDFMSRLIAGFRRIKVDSPLKPSTTLSGLVSARQGQRVLDYIDIGKKEGANLVTGGSRTEVVGNEYGYFIEPTIFEVENHMRIAQEEIFGPVLSVIRWTDYEDMIAQANGTKYGLAAGLYTTNIANALNTADRLEAGSVWINKYFNLIDGSPIGGYKNSGFGSENAAETLNLYTHLKSITLTTKAADPFYLPAE